MASHSKAPPRSRGKRGGNGAEISARRQQLYALPLADFTRARDALAKELASEGHSKEAQELRKLKRPVLGAWIVNQLVHQHPEDVEELFASARALEKAQRRAMSGLAPEPLKEASRAFQRALDTLMTHVNDSLAASGRAAAGELIRQVDETLRTASLGSQDERSALAQGMLTRPLRSSGLFGDFSSLQLVGPAPARGPRKPAPPPPPQRATKPAERPEPVPSPTDGEVLHGPWAPRTRVPKPPPRPSPPPKKHATPPARRHSQRELQAEAKAQARRDREVELRRLQREARQQTQLAEKVERNARQNVVRTKAVLRTAEGRTRYARSAFEAAETRAQRAREALETAEEQVRQAREALEATKAEEQEQAEEVSRASREAEAAEQALTQARRHLKQVESRRRR